MVKTEFSGIKNDLLESRKDYLEDNPGIDIEEDVFLAAVDNAIEEIEVYEEGKCNRFRQLVKITGLIVYIEGLWDLNEDDDDPDLSHFLENGHCDEDVKMMLEKFLVDDDISQVLGENFRLDGEDEDSEQQIISIFPKDPKGSSEKKKPAVSKKEATKKKR